MKYERPEEGFNITAWLNSGQADQHWSTERDVRRGREPPIGAADGSSPIISQDTPIRSIRVPMSSGSAEERAIQDRRESAPGGSAAE